MRVLMLGWEVSPRHGGGLGVACRDIARGLAGEGLEVTFVVPRAPESREEGSGANLELVRADRIRPRRRRARYRAAASAGDAGEDGARESVELLAVESALRPYQRAETYAADLPRARRPQLRARPAPLVRLELEETDELEPPYPFTGGYGPDLYTEVERFARAVGELVRGRAFDVVHAHDWMTWPAALRAAERAGLPLVLHVHATELDRGGRRPDPRIRAVEELALRRADRVVCVSRWTAALLRRRYDVDPEKLTVVHNGVPEVVAPPAGPRARSGGPLVLFVGRLTRQKGPEHFLEAAARVHAVDPDVSFAVCGDGDLLPDVVGRAAALGLQDRIRFTGYLDPPDVRRLLALADVFVMPSVSEPFGLAALEAADAGVPVIVSRQSGVAEALHHCLLVDWWDAREIASKILAVLRRPDLRAHLVEGARGELERLRWDPCATSLRGVFEEVAG